MKISIRAARVNAGLTQEDVVKSTGWARSTLIRWEQYKTKPSQNKREILCSLYGISADEIAWEK